MWRVFNQGIGMIVVIDKPYQEQAMQLLRRHQPKVIGEIVASNNKGVRLL